MQLELLQFQRAVQIGFEADPLFRRKVHAGRKALDVGAAALLGAVHRGVRVRVQGLDRRAVARVEGDADAGRGVNFESGDLNRCSQRLDDFEPDLLSLLGQVRLAEDHHKFIAADARHRVDASYHAHQPAGDVLQQFIAGAVTQGIIDDFEAVQIEHAHREPLAGAFRLRDGLTHAVIQQHPVGQACQRIVGGQMAQLFVGHFQALGALGNVFFK